MNPEAEHSPEPDDPGGPLSSLEAFNAWRRANPEKAAGLENQMRRVAAGEMGELTPEIIENAKKAAAASATERAVQNLVFDMKELMAGMEDIVFRRAGREKVPELLQRIDALVDDALGLPEPHRSKFLPELVALREAMRKVG